MGLLDQLMQMKSQGMTDSQIIQTLQEHGVSPREISEAMSQAQIKKAIAAPIDQNMEASILSNQGEEMEEEYPQQPMQDFSQPQAPVYTPQDQYQGYDQGYQQEYYDQSQNYGEQQYPASYGATDNSTLMEIAEQVFADKIKKMQSQVDSMTEFQSLSQTKLALIEERLVRIESLIDQLQMSILEKVGSYGQNLSSIKKEMSMMQDSFGKVVNAAADSETRRRK
ncbi:hypothetical protein HYT23_02700 [Candidatus Pacearchaeota archaeon]|nr:hypothetical protein [Candidatus Pacearchaeota archaeon]